MHWENFYIASVLAIVIFTTCECFGHNSKSVLYEFIPANLPSNLNATVSIYDSDKHQLQLNITWTLNKGGYPARSYNIHVWTLNDTNEHCYMEHYYAFIENGNSSSWVVSPEDITQDLNTFSIVPACSYRIRLEANPHNGKMYKELNYTVPDCVGEICSCHHAEELPAPLLNVNQIRDKTVNITWFVTDVTNISSFTLRVGPKLLDGPMSAMYNLNWSKQVAVLGGNSFYMLYEAGTYGKHAIFVRAVDYKKCQGPESQTVFLIEENSYKLHLLHRKEIVMKIVLLFGAIIVTISILMTVFHQHLFFCIKRNKEATLVINKRVFYKKIYMKSQKVFRRSDSLQQRNILYVEQEIEEAKTRGEVDGFEISYNRLTIEREIGRGAFGQVFLARAEAIRGSPETLLVAVKKLKAKVGNEERDEFLEEISMLKRVGQHPNIVSLLACVTLQADLCMVMEYIPCGDLRKYLHNLRHQYETRKPSVTSMSDKVNSSLSTISTSISSQPYAKPKYDVVTDLECVLDHRELHNFALQIARGMEHLEARRITHRDLAARNILIDNNKVLKISDFGLSRQGIYVNTRRRKVPLRWLSIEAMRDSLYSSKSDVWAFAIVLWEIGTLGGFPYALVSDLSLLQFLKMGNRLDKPEIVSQNLYSMMMICWSENPDNRPMFAELVSYLEPRPNQHIYVEFPPETQLPPSDCSSVPCR